LKREFFSTTEVAELLGITPFTIRRYIQLRKLKAVKLEGIYRVRQTDLEQFLKAREIETEEELAAQERETPKTSAPRPRAKPVAQKGAAQRATPARPKSRAARRRRKEV
jgi:excisionase family DNA binding protein